MNTIQSCDIDVRKSLYENIILSGSPFLETLGGSTMYPGFPTRLENDVEALHKKNVSKGKSDKVKVKVRVSTFYRRILLSDSMECSSELESRPQSWTSHLMGGSRRQCGMMKDSRVSKCHSID